MHTHPEDSVDSVSHSATTSTAAEHYRLGFQECLSETMHFLVEVEGFFARDSLCVQLISHLQQHCEKILATSKCLFSIETIYIHANHCHNISRESRIIDLNLLYAY